jgi:hypothetical protein
MLETNGYVPVRLPAVLNSLIRRPTLRYFRSLFLLLLFAGRWWQTGRTFAGRGQAATHRPPAKPTGLSYRFMFHRSKTSKKVTSRSIAFAVGKYQALSLRSSISPTTAGFALPLLSFITWPLRELSAASLPAL